MTIDKLIEDAVQIVEKLQPSEELQDPKNIGLTDVSPIMYDVLSKVDAINTVQGTNKVYIGLSMKDIENVKNELEHLKSTLNNVYNALKQKEDGYMSRNEVILVLKENNENEDSYYTIIGILSSLDLATSAGRGRIGGIKIYNKEENQENIQKAESQIAQETTIEEQTKVKVEKEHVLYPSAVKEISGLGYQAIILGGNRRLPGEWNTPDVFGYKINRYKNIGGAEIDITTVEVKWEISKYAIAEAISHQKLGHRTYLMVHQELEEIDKSYLSDLVSNGIGLICKKGNEHKLIILSKRNNPDKIIIDDFLGLAVDTSEIEIVKREIAKHFYTDYFKPILPN